MAEIRVPTKTDRRLLPDLPDPSMLAFGPWLRGQVDVPRRVVLEGLRVGFWVELERLGAASNELGMSPRAASRNLRAAWNAFGRACRESLGIESP